MNVPIFPIPRTTTVVLDRDIWVKGKGMPADGVQLFHEGEEVTAQTDNGVSWYLIANYRGRTIKVATIL